MPASLAASKRRKPITTYGRPFRSKFSSFKVFQNATDEEGTGKQSGLFFEDYDSPPPQLPQSPRGRVSSFVSRGMDDRISEDDPFTDCISSLGFKLEPPKKAHSGKATSCPRPRKDKENKFKRLALASKSTNRPRLVQSTTTAGVAHGSAATVDISPPKREARPSPKMHPKKKPRLGPQLTPQINLKVEPPRRPRKFRHTGPSLDEDSPTTIPPSKAYRPDFMSRFQRYSGISENGFEKPYSEPPTGLGTSGTGMNDSIGIITGAWVNDRARDILSETKKAAGRIIRVSSPSVRYKNKQRNDKKSKLKDRVQIAIQKPSGAPKTTWGKGEIAKYPVTNRVSFSETESSDQGIVSLQNFLEGPFSASEDYGFEQDVDVGHPAGFSSAPKASRETPDGLWEPESIQHLQGIHDGKVAITKQPDSKFKFGKANQNSKGAWDINASSFLANSSPSLGTRRGFNHPETDDEMPSSSPIAKSTPKKDWAQCKDFGTSNSLNWETNRPVRGQGHSPWRPVVIAFGSSDTDYLEHMVAGESLNNFENEYRSKGGGGTGEVESPIKFNRTEIRRVGKDSEEKNGVSIRSRETRRPLLGVVASRDGFCKSAYTSGISGRNKPRRDDLHPMNTSIDREDVRKTRITIKPSLTGLEKELNLRKRDGEVIFTGGSTTGKLLPKSNQSKPTDRVTASRVAGGVGKKKQKSSLKYDRVEMGDDDIDELQMDLPGMRI